MVMLEESELATMLSKLLLNTTELQKGALFLSATY